MTDSAGIAADSAAGMQPSEAAQKAAVLADWSASLSTALGLDITVDIDGILSLAGVAAHTVIRPAAPLTTFLVGYAAGLAATASGAETAVEEAMRTARAVLAAGVLGGEVSGDSASGGVASGSTAPGEAAPGGVASGEAASGRTASGTTASGIAAE